jgi:hypothetical protein
MRFLIDRAQPSLALQVIRLAVLLLAPLVVIGGAGGCRDRRAPELRDEAEHHPHSAEHLGNHQAKMTQLRSRLASLRRDCVQKCPGQDCAFGDVDRLFTDARGAKDPSALATAVEGAEYEVARMEDKVSRCTAKDAREEGA